MLKKQYRVNEKSPFMAFCSCGKRFDIRRGDKCTWCKQKKKSELWNKNKTWHDDRRVPPEIKVPNNHYHKDENYKENYARTQN